MSVINDKTKLRSCLKKLRSHLPPEQVAKSSKVVSEHILACDAYRKAKCIMGYLAFGNELSVDDVLKQALLDGKIVTIPYIISTTEFKAVAIKSMNNFCLDRYGIRTVRDPVNFVSPDRLDLVLVPGVAFGRNGSRIGMGGGYYDRFLPLATKAIFMGVVYNILLRNTLPCDSYDSFVNLLVSESGVITL